MDQLTEDNGTGFDTLRRNDESSATRALKWTHHTARPIGRQQLKNMWKRDLEKAMWTSAEGAGSSTTQN